MKRFVINLSSEYANLCSRVIAPSSSIRDLLIKRGVKKPVAVLPTGVDLAYFKGGDGQAFRRRHDIPAGGTVIGHVGRLAREKNLPFLASAVTGCLRDHPGAVFMVAGAGDAEQEIRRIFADRQLADRLIMPGILRQKELADCYRAMDIFVFASRSETQGLVLMEAMASEVPVIALQASGVDDVVEDGQNGLVLPADASTDDFAAAVNEALASGQAIAWQPAALRTAERFSRENCAADLFDLYQSTIQKQSGPKMKPDVLDTLKKNFSIEWELLQEKAAAMKNSLGEENAGQ